MGKMEWYNIQKWQDNVAEDIANDKLNYNENLINAILEVAAQLSLIRQDFALDRWFNLDSGRKIALPQFPKEFRISNLPKIPAKYLNANGEIDLSQVTGEDAREYFVKFLGMSLPVGISRRKLRDERL